MEIIENYANEKCEIANVCVSLCIQMYNVIRNAKSVASSFVALATKLKQLPTDLNLR